MTQEELIEMLRASCDKDRVDPEQNGFWVIVTEELEAFAKLVAEKEREACAKECWKQMGLLPTQAWTVNPYEQCINAIRERGKE